MPIYIIASFSLSPTNTFSTKWLSFFASSSFSSPLRLLVTDACIKQRWLTSPKLLHFHLGLVGIGSMAVDFNGGHIAGVVPSLYKDGAGCGACFQIRCKNTTLCTKHGTKVVVTDLNSSNETGIVLSSRAFKAMANKGMRQDILKLGIVDVEYKRVPCDYKKQNLAVRVEEMSQKPNYLAIKFLYQGGQTEIVAVDVAQVDSPNWSYLSRNYGAIWDTSRVPAGPLQLRLLVTAGYDGKWVWARNVFPADWNSGVIYDSGVQITDIAQEGCSPCDDSHWK
ncbi:hypothetical protein F0562_020947 [Nyssa sinensis]|uniref:Expansin-like EG45 domain-containing protein n=1 Tax=Nyssa sinensis TaxID=561372 RepID=A0A5J5BTB7_9ASTE|nr:hypothetical protein F0562_020947 [Nyssa sinensis]